MTSSSTTGRRALAAYSAAPRGDRLHVWVRWRTCPFASLEAHVPTSGRILDVGCGHGLFPILLALSEPDRSVTGTDVDAAKLVVAGEAATSAGVAITFEPAGDGVPQGPWDAITIVDVLYLLGHEGAHALLCAAAGELAPGGTLLVKEIDERPLWKYRLARVQEWLATRVLRITEGSGVNFLPPADIAATLERTGLHVERVRLDQGRLHPHHLLIGHRPTAG